MKEMGRKYENMEFEVNTQKTELGTTQSEFNNRIKELKAELKLQSEELNLFQQTAISRKDVIEVATSITENIQSQLDLFSKQIVREEQIEKIVKEQIKDFDLKYVHTLKKQVEFVVQPAMTKFENEIKVRFLKIVEAYEARAESKVATVIKKFEEVQDKARREWEKANKNAGPLGPLPKPVKRTPTPPPRKGQKKITRPAQIIPQADSRSIIHENLTETMLNTSSHLQQDEDPKYDEYYHSRKLNQSNSQTAPTALEKGKRSTSLNPTQIQQNEDMMLPIYHFEETIPEETMREDDELRNTNYQQVSNQ